jgi:hypothetical protein
MIYGKAFEDELRSSGAVWDPGKMVRMASPKRQTTKSPR